MAEVSGVEIAHHRIAHSVSMAAGWVFNHLECFSPFDEDDFYSLMRMKACTEFALMLTVYVKLTGNRRATCVKRGVELLEHACDREDFADWAIRLPAALVNYAELCAAVNELTGKAPRLKRVVQSAVDGGTIFQLERVPYRLLEMRTTLDWAGIEHSLPLAGHLYDETILGKPLSTPLLSNEALYAVTHVILFASRFGLTQTAFPESFRNEQIRAILSDLLVVACQECNWDVLGELLLCWDCMCFKSSHLTSAAWNSFLGASRTDGAVLPRPLKATKRGLLLVKTADSRDDKVPDFDYVYHTTLVAILAGLLQLYRSGNVELISGNFGEAT